ncbi:hypothetical protein M413DRAFT_150768 [Hebeloma cylindrosporum]|uniref:Uncharacterized protein n=1 Tax=Hebeloma cylindrosporum TaxID=76867 RepID=A0A0C3CBE5_HEBCY|nr:hypothetical protein M413DRAFT_150768 [Hebeloma cylindrosporum h7]
MTRTSSSQPSSLNPEQTHLFLSQVLPMNDSEYQVSFGVRGDRRAHMYASSAMEEAPIYQFAHYDASLGDTIQQRQRREWGIQSIPSFHPSSSALASMIEPSRISPTKDESSPTCYPTPESLCDDDGHSYLPVVPPDTHRGE